MTKVEYMKLPGIRIQNSYGVVDIDKLNEMGAGGWELILFTWMNNKISFAYFMRKSYQSKKSLTG